MRDHYSDLAKSQEKIQRQSSQGTAVVDDGRAIRAGRVPYVLGEVDSFLWPVA